MTEPLVGAGAPAYAPLALREAGRRSLRPVVRRSVHRQWDVRQRGAHHVPVAGPVILASNHVGWLDGPLLILCAPRHAHALVKREAFEGRTARVLRLPESRPARGARIDVVYGEPLRIAPVPWPRTRAHVAEVGRRITDHLRHHVEWAADTGHLQLPGPLPEGTADV